MSQAAGEVPVHRRVHLTHALLQHVADAHGIDLLHIKGPALHADLLATTEGVPVARRSSDADVLVRPRDARRFVDLLTDVGASRVAAFDSGSPFDHAATVWFDHLGYADVHRRFPGFRTRADEAFDILWAGRQTTPIAHQACSVPDLDAQRLLLLLHSARSATPGDRDSGRAWGAADDATRARVRQLAADLGATVALAAAIGELDQHRDAPDYDLWHLFSRQPEHGRLAEWRARIKAAQTTPERISLLVRSWRVNRDHLALRLGRPATRRERWDEWVIRLRRGLREVRRRSGR